MTRGIAVFAAGWVSLAGVALTPVIVLAVHPARQSDAWLALPGVLLGVLLVCWLLLLPLIVCFNRPRLLVVPYLRDDEGALVAWWRRRRRRQISQRNFAHEEPTKKR